MRLLSGKARCLLRAASLVLASVVMFNSGAQASTATSDVSDWWYTPSESGSGVNVVQQNDFLGIAFFVFDSNRNPIWYTAGLAYAGNFTWTGDLIITNGPYFGGPWTGGVTRNKVGTATFTASNLNAATLQYTVNGVTVTKSLQRLTFKNENLTGNFAVGYSTMSTGCANPAYNGQTNLVGNMSVTQTGSALSISVNWSSGIACSFTGQYTQAGKLGFASGTMTCSNGASTNLQLAEITPSISGFTARIVNTTDSLGCTSNGYIGGIPFAQ